MTQMGKNVPCLYEQMTATPAAAGTQQQKSSEMSLGYEEMLTGPTGAAVIVPAGGANGHFRPSPDKIEEVQTVDKMGYNSWKGMLARNIGRAGESWRTLTLGELREAEVDMFCTVIVGNVSTKEIAGRLITPRGYKNV